MAEGFHVIKFLGKGWFENQKLVLAASDVLGETVVDAYGINPLIGFIHVF